MSVRGYTKPTELAVEELLECCQGLAEAVFDGRTGDVDIFIEGVIAAYERIDRLWPKWRWSESLINDAERSS